MPSAPKTSPQTKPAASSGTNYPIIKAKTVIAAAEEYYGLLRDESRIDTRKKELKPILLEAMNGAPTAYAGARVLSASAVNTVPATPDRTITKEMIGQTIPGGRGRAGYTQLSVK
jgi:hypothetical protein